MVVVNLDPVIIHKSRELIDPLPSDRQPDYRIDNSFGYARPYMDEFMRSLLTNQDIVIALCMPVKRRNIVNFVYSLCSNKRLNKLKTTGIITLVH